MGYSGEVEPENVDDRTEGGYTVIDPADFPPGYVEALADKYGKECPDAECICKNDSNG